MSAADGGQNTEVPEGLASMAWLLLIVIGPRAGVAAGGVRSRS